MTAPPPVSPGRPLAPPPPRPRRTPLRHLDPWGITTDRPASTPHPWHGRHGFAPSAAPHGHPRSATLRESGGAAGELARPWSRRSSRGEHPTALAASRIAGVTRFPAKTATLRKIVTRFTENKGLRAQPSSRKVARTHVRGSVFSSRPTVDGCTPSSRAMAAWLSPAATRARTADACTPSSLRRAPPPGLGRRRARQYAPHTAFASSALSGRPQCGQLGRFIASAYST
jgi:hypothetical protein